MKVRCQLEARPCVGVIFKSRIHGLHLTSHGRDGHREHSNVRAQIKQRRLGIGKHRLHHKEYQFIVPGSRLGNLAGNHLRRRPDADLGDNTVKERPCVTAQVRCDSGKVLLLAKYPQLFPTVGVDLILRQVPFGVGAGLPKKKELMQKEETQGHQYS